MSHLITISLLSLPPLHLLFYSPHSRQRNWSECRSNHVIPLLIVLQRLDISIRRVKFLTVVPKSPLISSCYFSKLVLYSTPIYFLQCSHPNLLDRMLPTFVRHDSAAFLIDKHKDNSFTSSLCWIHTFSMCVWILFKIEITYPFHHSHTHTHTHTHTHFNYL